MTIAKMLTTAAVAAFLSTSGATANTVTLVFDLNSSSTNDPGDVTSATGIAELSFADVGDDLEIGGTLTNTSVVDSELEAFGFDIIGSFISFGAGTVIDNFDLSEMLPGNILVDVCAFSSDSCGAGGMPNGLDPGESGSFSILTDTDLTAATAVAAYKSLFFDGGPFVTGKNPPDPTAALRFRAVADGAGSETRFNPSDGGLTPVPLPAAGWMLLAGLGGIAAFKRRKTA